MELGIDEFLRVHTKVGKITVKALSDLDVRERDRIALRASRDYADALGEEDSEEFQEHVAPLLEMDAVDMRTAIASVQERQFWRDAEDELPFDYVPFPDEPTLEERQDVLRRREEHEDGVKEKRRQAVAKRLANFIEKMQDWSDEMLRRQLRNRAIANLSWARYADVYTWATLALACFDGDGKPYFSSYEKVAKTSSKMTAKLFEAYRHVDSVDPWELEKNVLTGPTQDGSEPESSPP